MRSVVKIGLEAIVEAIVVTLAAVGLALLTGTGDADHLPTRLFLVVVAIYAFRTRKLAAAVGEFVMTVGAIVQRSRADQEAARAAEAGITPKED